MEPLKLNLLSLYMLNYMKADSLCCILGVEDLSRKEDDNMYDLKQEIYLALKCSSIFKMINRKTHKDIYTPVVIHEHKANTKSITPPNVLHNLIY